MGYKIRKYKNTKYIVADLDNCNTDIEILTALSECPNGNYAHWVCKNCGSYHHSPSPPIRINIVNECFYCKEN